MWGRNVEWEAGLGAGHAAVCEYRQNETYLIDGCCQKPAAAFAVGAVVREPTNRPQAAAKQRMAATLARDQLLPFI